MRQSETDVAQQLGVLPRLGIEALRALWVEQFGRAPSFRARKDLLVRILAYRIQESAQDGLSPGIRKRLRALSGRIGTASGWASRPMPRLKVGTRLVREWKGQTYVVSVLEDGVECRDKRYGSLSEVARAITGTRWSGPAFFGLKQPPSKQSE